MRQSKLKGGDVMMTCEDRLAETLPSSAKKAIEVLEHAGKQAYVVGGFVRDAILGRPCHDVDIATDALWYHTREHFLEAGYRVIETGSAHGTVTVLIDGDPIEITTYRTDGTYTDQRRPDSVRFVKNIEEDLARRDFTVNAVAWNPARGLVDPFGGVADMARGLIRCVGEPFGRFDEDALRIMRGVRFSAQLSFAVDAATAAAIHATAPSLSSVAVERIAQEYGKIVEAPFAVDALRAFPDVAAMAVPHVAPMVGFDQKSRWHCYDVWEHCLHALGFLSADAPSPLCHATLLHDIGKPSYFVLGEDGRGHFYGHEEAGARLLVEDYTRLRWPVGEVRLMEYLVHYHDRPIEDSPRGIRRALARANRVLNTGADGAHEAFSLLLRLKRADMLAHAHRAVHKRMKELDRVQAQYEEELERGCAFCVADLAIGGADLLEMGVERGPLVGYILKRLVREVVDDVLPNTPDALRARAKAFM